MDPVSAVGFASAILTFVDFSIKLVRGSAELYRSAAVSDENIRLEAVASEFNRVTHAISQTPLTSGKELVTAHSTELQRLATACRGVAERLSDLLDTLQRQDGNRTLRSVQAAWRNLREKGKVAGLEKSLNEYRSEILLRLSLILHENEVQVQEQLEVLDQSNRELFRDSYEQLTGIKNAVNAMDSKVQKLATTSELGKSMSEIRGELERIIQQLQNAPKFGAAELNLLNRLYFESFHRRLDSIEDADFGTFTWLVDGNLDEGSVLDPFKDAVDFFMDVASQLGEDCDEDDIRELVKNHLGTPKNASLAVASQR